MIWTILFLMLVGLLLPFMAWSSYHALKTVEPQDLPSSAVMALQTAAVHVVVLVVALAAAWGGGLSLTWVAPPSAAALGGAVVLIVAGLAYASWEARRPLDRGDVLRKAIRAGGVDAASCLSMVTAAVAEEIAYRGVLFGLLATVMPAWFAAAASAALFGLAHYNQGPKPAVVSALFGLALQGVYTLAGALLLPILAHLAYDVIVSILGTRLHRREQAVAGDASESQILQDD